MMSSTTGPIFRGMQNRTNDQTARQAAAADPYAAPTRPVVNATPAQIESYLAENVTAGYRPQLPVWQTRDDQFSIYDFCWDIESMLRHDSVSTPLANVMAPVAQMQVEFRGSSKRVCDFALEEWTKFLEKYVRLVQEDAYPYGWMGGECIYGQEQGKEVLLDFHDFHPRDVIPWTADGKIDHLQIKNCPGGLKDLSGCTRGIPAKGFFYAHRPRYGQCHGRSQIEGAWRPWRRLTGRDGAQELADLALYRYATGTVVMRAPIMDTTANWQANLPGTRQSAMQRAMEIVESLKTGGGIVLPSAQYPNGTSQWDIAWETPQTNIPELMKIEDGLYIQCSKAIGWPPELTEASATGGSGYSGRLIPLEAFLLSVQHVCLGLFHAWWKQIGKPLIWWNFGREAWVKPKMIPLLQSYKRAAQPMPPGGPQPNVPPQPAMAQAEQPPAAAPGEPEQPPAAAPGEPAKIPYLGPRGGRGFRDEQGRVHYGAMLSTGSHAFERAMEITESSSLDDDRRLRSLAKHLPDLEPAELDFLEEQIRLAGGING